MENYKPHSAITIVSLGRKDVVAQLPFVTISGRIPRFIKSRDLFVGKTRKQMGLNPVHILMCPLNNFLISKTLFSE